MSEAVLFKSFGSPDNDEGEWVIYRKEDGVQFRVRQIPDKIDAELRRKVQGRQGQRTQTVKYRRGAAESEVNLDEADQLAELRARFSLLDSKGVMITAGDEEAASDITKAIGEPVKAGDSVSLDGKWTQPVKDYVFGEFSGLCTWIVKASMRLRLQSSEDEELLAGN